MHDSEDADSDDGDGDDDDGDGGDAVHQQVDSELPPWSGPVPSPLPGVDAWFVYHMMMLSHITKDHLRIMDHYMDAHHIILTVPSQCVAFVRFVWHELEQVDHDDYSGALCPMEVN